MRPARRRMPVPARILPRILLLAAVVAAIVGLAPLIGTIPAFAQGAWTTSGQAHSESGRRIAYQYPVRELGSSVGPSDGLRRSGHAYRPLGAGNLTWHGGPVQHHPTQYLIFWGPAWTTTSHTPVPAAQLVAQYFTDMAATPFERVVTQYGDHSGTITNSDTLAAAVLDPAAPKTDNSCGANTVQDLAIMQEIAHVGQTLNWPAPSADATYFVFTPPHSPINDGEGHCSTQYFCAYHAWSTTTPGFAYAAIPYPDDSGCQVPRSPHHDLAGDSLVSTSSHEQLEAITDPQVGTGWMDADDFELADKCATDYGLGYTALAHGDRYEFQAEYSNASRSCVNSYTPPPPPHHTSSSGHGRRSSGGRRLGR